MSKIRIAEMLERTNIADTDLMIVEDDIDTKRTTIKELKRAFIGEEPDNYKFFTSQKVSELITGLEITIANSPSISEFNDLKQQMSNVIKNANANSEVQAARGTYSTLAERLAGDIKAAEEKYIQFPTVSYMGNMINLADIETAKVNLVATSFSEPTKVLIEGKNKYKYTVPSYSSVSKFNTNGFKMVFTTTQNAFEIPIGQVLPAGELIFYFKLGISSDFVKAGTVFKVIHSDGTATIHNNFTFGNVIRVVAGKPVRGFQILPNPSTIKNNMYLTLEDIMVSEDSTLEKYYAFCDQSFDVAANQTITKDLVLSRCVIKRVNSTNTSVLKGTLKASVVDTSYTGTKIRNEIEELKQYTTAPEDYCGLLTNKGDYYYAYESLVNDSTDLISITPDIFKMRNNQPSMKIQYLKFSDRSHPKFTMVLQNAIDLSDSRFISLQVYIDKTVSERYDDGFGIKMMISSDAIIQNYPTNFKYYLIGRQSFVQGWNTIKLKLADFRVNGNVNMGNITQINFELCSNNFTTGKTIWINSVIIDQMMRPTLLFAFDDFDKDGFSYTYPKLYSQGIPATIFANDKTTLTLDFMDKIAQLHYLNGWDLGNYGCNPDKEIMIEDENARDQYLAVRNSRQWFYDNFTSEVTSYAAPYDNFRPVTEPILREMGFTIAKEDADQYISLFTKNDLVVASRLLSNKSGCGSDVMNKRIDEIVETGQALCISTSIVSMYGSDIGATKESFENVIEHALMYKNRGELDIMTFKEFAEKCQVK